MKDLGLIHIYCGDGKGKSTASIGLMVRAAGNGLNVIFAQFLKNWKTGEIEALSNIPGIKILRSKKPFPFTDKMTDAHKAEITEIHNEILKEVIQLCENGECDVLVLDEIISTYSYNFIDKDLVDNFLKNRGKNIELIMTGRNPSPEFIEMADYVSEVKKIKHPFDKGVQARRGIEI
jgi:cob(I)alamin adenosyltransferase